MFQSVNHKYQGRGSLMAKFPMSNNVWPQIFQLVRCHILLCAWQLCSCLDHFMSSWVSSCSPAQWVVPVTASVLHTRVCTGHVVITGPGTYTRSSPLLRWLVSSNPPHHSKSLNLLSNQPSSQLLSISLLPNSRVSWIYSMDTEACLTFRSSSLS